MYHYTSPRTGWRGWLFGPNAGRGRGGIILEGEDVCVERHLDGRWRYYDQGSFRQDQSITVTCFAGVGGGSGTIKGRDGDKKHRGIHKAHDYMIECVGLK